MIVHRTTLIPINLVCRLTIVFNVFESFQDKSKFIQFVLSIFVLRAETNCKAEKLKNTNRMRLGLEMLKTSSEL